jgi:hypothetical protein
MDPLEFFASDHYRRHNSRRLEHLAARFADRRPPGPRIGRISPVSDASANPTRTWACVSRSNNGGHFVIATAAGLIALPAAVVCFSKFDMAG